MCWSKEGNQICRVGVLQDYDGETVLYIKCVHSILYNLLADFNTKGVDFIQITLTIYYASMCLCTGAAGGLDPVCAGRTTDEPTASRGCSSSWHRKRPRQDPQLGRSESSSS